MATYRRIDPTQIIAGGSSNVQVLVSNQGVVGFQDASTISLSVIAKIGRAHV